MRKNKFLLPLIGTFLLYISGCDGKNVTVQIQCNHDYEYREVDSNYHKEVCKKCGQMKPDSFKGHSFQSTGSNIFVCKDCICFMFFLNWFLDRMSPLEFWPDGTPLPSRGGECLPVIFGSSSWTSQASRGAEGRGVFAEFRYGINGSG